MATDPAITAEHIAAARLRLVLDAKLGRPTPDRVRRVAAMTAGDEPSPPGPPEEAHDPDSSPLDIRRLFEKQLALVRESAGDLPVWLLLVDVGAIRALNPPLSRKAASAARNRIVGLLSEASDDDPSITALDEDEFAVLITAPEDGPNSGISVAERMWDAVAGHDWREVLETDRQLHLRIGVTAVRPGEPLQQALDRADRTISEVKRRGGYLVSLAREDVKPFTRSERSP